MHVTWWIVVESKTCQNNWFFASDHWILSLGLYSDAHGVYVSE